jgi:outer membrane protein assembly factor BamB
VWQRQGLVAAHTAACDGMLYVRGARITALDAGSGATVWEREAAGCSPLFCVFGRLVFADASKPQALTVVEAATGRVTAEVALSNSCSGFTMVGSVGLVNTNDGVLHAVNAERVLQRGVTL